MNKEAQLATLLIAGFAVAFLGWAVVHLASAPTHPNRTTSALLRHDYGDGCKPRTIEYYDNEFSRGPRNPASIASRHPLRRHTGKGAVNLNAPVHTPRRWGWLHNRMVPAVLSVRL